MHGICLIPLLLGFVLSLPYLPYMEKYLSKLNTWFRKKQFFSSLSKEKYLDVTGYKICSLPDSIDIKRLEPFKDRTFTPGELTGELKKVNFNDEEIDIIILYISPFPSVKDPYIKGCKFVEKGNYEVALKYFDAMSPSDRNFEIARKTRQSVEELMKTYYESLDNYENKNQ